MTCMKNDSVHVRWFIRHSPHWNVLMFYLSHQRFPLQVIMQYIIFTRNFIQPPSAHSIFRFFNRLISYSYDGYRKLRFPRLIFPILLYCKIVCSNATTDITVKIRFAFSLQKNDTFALSAACTHINLKRLTWGRLIVYRRFNFMLPTHLQKKKKEHEKKNHEVSAGNL